MISVCMATYNGSNWITEQMQSIVSQLGPDDEVVVVDDASIDNTLEKIAAFGDARIRVSRNPVNLGVDRTFEKALAMARGDILFLSDQDDIWFPEKVDRIMQAFRDDLSATLVLSDALMVDAEGNPTGYTYFGHRGGFVPGVLPNIVKSKFLGCAMAFRASLRQRFLPFPHPIPGHDMWIGLVSEVYGKTLYLNQSLMGYRRHGNNASPIQRQGLRRMLVWRWQLIRGLALLVWNSRRE